MHIFFYMYSVVVLAGTFCSDSTHQDVTNTSILVGVGYEPLNSN